MDLSNSNDHRVLSVVRQKKYSHIHSVGRTFLLIFSMKRWWITSTVRLWRRSQGSSFWVVPRGALAHSGNLCIATRRRRFELMGTHFSWPDVAHPVPKVRVQILKNFFAHTPLFFRGSPLRNCKDCFTWLSCKNRNNYIILQQCFSMNGSLSDHCRAWWRADHLNQVWWRREASKKSRAVGHEDRNWETLYYSNLIEYYSID